MAVAAGNAQAIQKANESLAAFDERYRDLRKDEPQFDIDVMRRAKVVDATMAGTLTIDIDLGHEYTNGANNLHGAAVALLFDQFTTVVFSILLPADAPFPPGGVTRALNLTYLRPIRLPATVRVHAEVVQHGRSVSLAKGSIVSPDGKKLYATCEHHKVAAGAERLAGAVASKL
ncbi:hypothetical protein MMC34_005918 [Xylographa carneopallida]|nr:hypothetical protein [Xylographa carneopallida]